MDVAFLGRRAYVLVTLVGPEVGGGAVDGIYRVDGSGQVTVVADIGAWAVAHPPVPAYFVPTGVHYALQSYRGGFLVADGHHNRLLRVTLDGEVAELAAFPNVVPTGIATAGRSVYLAQAGPVPHEPGDGKVVRVDPRAGRRSPEAGTPGTRGAASPAPCRPTHLSAARVGWPGKWLRAPTTHDAAGRRGRRPCRTECLLAGDSCGEKALAEDHRIAIGVVQFEQRDDTRLAPNRGAGDTTRAPRS